MAAQSVTFSLGMEEASHPVVRRVFDQGRSLGLAWADCLRATRLEAAAVKSRWGAGIVDNVPWLSRSNRVRRRDSLQQCLGIRMQGLIKELVLRGQFDKAAQVHYRNAVADVAHHRKIM